MYLLPLFVMLTTSFKSLDEIREGNVLALPQAFTLEPWRAAWGSACIGLTCEGISGNFWNSIRMVVPPVAISTFMGALHGYVTTNWRFPGPQWIFALMIFGCFLPFQLALVPLPQVLGN